MAFWSQADFKEPLRANKWYIEFTSILKDVRFALKECKKPSYTITTTKHRCFNYVVNLPGTITWEPVTIKFASTRGDDSSKDASVLIYDLLLLGGSETPKTFLESTLSKTRMKNALESDLLNIIQIDADGAPVEIWSLHNAILTVANFGSLSYDNENIVDIDCTITYDWAELNNEDVARKLGVSTTPAPVVELPENEKPAKIEITPPEPPAPAPETPKPAAEEPPPPAPVAETKPVDPPPPPAPVAETKPVDPPPPPAPEAPKPTPPETPEPAPAAPKPVPEETPPPASDPSSKQPIASAEGVVDPISKPAPTVAKPTAEAPPERAAGQNKKSDEPTQQEIKDALNQAKKSVQDSRDARKAQQDAETDKRLIEDARENEDVVSKKLVKTWYDDSAGTILTKETITYSNGVQENTIRRANISEADKAAGEYEQAARKRYDIATSENSAGKTQITSIERTFLLKARETAAAARNEANKIAGNSQRVSASGATKTSDIYLPTKK